MFRFFSKLRKQILDQKRFNKYLIYAIGEIFLVVIGILIALQVNNWNVNRQEQIFLNEKLRNQVELLKEDREVLKGGLENMILKIYGIERILKWQGIGHRSFEVWDSFGLYVVPYAPVSNWNKSLPEEKNLDFIEIVILVAGAGELRTLNSIIFDEMVASGTFSKINNDSLRRNLINYYSVWDSEYNRKYNGVLTKFRDHLKTRGILIYDFEEIEDPLSFLTENAETIAALKEIMYESIWMGHLINQNLEQIDWFIDELENEISKM